MGVTEAKGGSAVSFELSATILRPRDEVYRAWCDFERHPRFFPHLESVRVLENGDFHYVWRGVAGLRYEWTNRATVMQEGKRLAWHTLPGSLVQQEGKVSFEDAPGGRGTVVRLWIRNRTPSLGVGGLVMDWIGGNPRKQLAEGLRHFKQFMECGEVATVETQPAGRRSPLGRMLSPHA
jgi:uncharacterized membrane protein